jgi:hypothetical protein
MALHILDLLLQRNDERKNRLPGGRLRASLSHITDQRWRMSSTWLGAWVVGSVKEAKARAVGAAESVGVDHILVDTIADAAAAAANCSDGSSAPKKKPATVGQALQRV